MDFKTYLKKQQSKGLPVFFDGGMGSMIQSSGITEYNIPEDLSITHPDLIKNIHRQYIDAGSNVITSNLFGINPLKLESTPYTIEQYITASMTVLKQAINEAKEQGNTRQLFAAWDTGQIGRLIEPMGDMTFDQAYEAYKTAAVLAEKAGAQVAIIETQSDLYEIKAAVLAVQENTNMSTVVTCTFQNNLRTLTGADVQTVVTYLESLHVDILGFNCGGSLKEDEQLIEQFCKYSHTPILSQPNADIPILKNGRTVYLVSPETFTQTQAKARSKGVFALGGCCGTTPDHIRAMVQAVDSMGYIEPSKPITPTDTFICSYNQTVQIGSSAGPMIVGERINPTGKKRVKAALLDGDVNFFIGEAESQINAGAQILDVNVGLPGIDEGEMMKATVKKLQSAFNTPLQLDSSEPPVLEKALRYYNGKALINSVNGRQDVMDKVFPLVKHYGGSVVALCIDEAGIAPSAQGRADVARKIITEAAKYGIEPRDILIDTLTLTVSSQQKEALETLKAITILKNEYKDKGLRFILGVSNISFGLPRRDIINSRFFAMALYAGLDACIINPLSQPMMETYNGYRALAGFDTSCLQYIDKYTGSQAPVYENASVPQQEARPAQLKESKNITQSKVKLAEDLSDDEHKLIDIIYKGYKDDSAQLAKNLLALGKTSVDIINRCIVPALDMVGQDYEKGVKFLPQLLLSADTVSNAFEVIKQHLAATGVKQKSKGSIVIATVYGDIHDIGKNIVKAMLENYGYTVIDLGKNVPYETIINTVIDKKVQLVGLSALMTTTVGNMETTIKLLRQKLSEQGLTTRIMVGGAVLTQDYADKIGADYYAKDAMASVAIAKEVFGEN